MRTEKTTAATATATASAARGPDGWNLEVSQLVCAALMLAIALLAVRIVALW